MTVIAVHWPPPPQPPTRAAKGEYFPAGPTPIAASPAEAAAVEQFTRLCGPDVYPVIVADGIGLACAHTPTPAQRYRYRLALWQLHRAVCGCDRHR